MALTHLFCSVAFCAIAATGLGQSTNIVWHDGTTLPIEGKAFADTEQYYDRLPASMKGKAPGSVWGLSHDSAGMCFRFVTDAPHLYLRWSVKNGGLAMTHMPATGVSGIDVYKWAEGGWRFVKTGFPNAVSNAVDLAWAPGTPCLVYLPLYNGIASFSLGIQEGKSIRPAPARASGVSKPVVIYGTSITQGGCASRPGMAWTAIAGRVADVPVVNLGFSGSGKMEPSMVDAVAGIDASLYVLDCLWNMDDAMIRERFEPFVRELRKRRPSTPILVAEDCNVFNQAPTSKAKIIRGVYDKLKVEDPALWKSLYYLEAKEMLGHDCEGTVDGCHPNDWGMMQMGRIFGAAIKDALR